MSYSDTSDLELSQKDFERLLVLAPDMANTIHSELEKLNTIRKACKDEERKRLAGKLFVLGDSPTP